MRIEKI